MNQDAQLDIQLMLKVKENDDIKAFEQLYQRYRGPIANFFYRLHYQCATQLVEDYTQEVFMRIWRARKGYQATGKFSTFIFQIAKNYWINEREKLKRVPPTYPLEGDQGDDDALTYKDLLANNKSTSPGEAVLRKEMGMAIDRAINELDEKHRLVFVLAHLQQFKYKDIAQILDIPIGTVKSRMSNAERKLRAKLVRYLKQ